MTTRLHLALALIAVAVLVACGNKKEKVLPPEEVKVCWTPGNRIETHCWPAPPPPPPMEPVERKFPTKRTWYFSDLVPGGTPVWGFVRLLPSGTPAICLAEEVEDKEPLKGSDTAMSKVYRDKTGKYIARLSDWARGELESGTQALKPWSIEMAKCVPVLIEEPKR